MLAGFIIWSAVAAVLLGIGIQAWRSQKAVGFFAGVTAPKVRDVKKYNHAVAVLWFVYALLFELLGLPFLFLRKNAAGFLLCVLGTAVISIGLMVAYTRVLHRHEEPRGK